jgi:hypothetical protein
MKTRLLIIIGLVAILSIIAVGYSYQSYLFDHKEDIPLVINMTRGNPKFVISDDSLEKILEYCKTKEPKPFWNYYWENDTHFIVAPQCQWHLSLSPDEAAYGEDDESVYREGPEPSSPDKVIKSITLHDVPYQELIENEQEYIGKMLYYKGKISNIHDPHSSGYTAKIAKMAVTPGAGWVDFIELSYNNSKLKDDSFKKVWGMYNGINDDTGLPMFQVFIIE